MSKEMLINVSEGEECRIALVEDGKLEELYMERTSFTSHVGNIYKGRVTNVEPSIQAAFVDFGLGRNGFLHISDLMPSYFGGGGEDIQETVGRKMARRDRPPIQRCIRRGDEIVVQIIKEGIGTKGPTLSTYLAVPGRILVMMPGMSKMGVSRKIEDDEERRRLRQILDSLESPDGVGFIIRTAGVGKTKVEIQRDLTYLTRLWQTFVKKRDGEPGPLELYTEGDLVSRTVRDVFTTDVDRIVVDNKEVAKRVKEVVKLANPRTKNKVELYEEPIPLFHKYGIEGQIEQMHSRHVPLPSGGSLVIDSTEAIVAIDVNSGKFRLHNDAEMTAFKTDMEAADEIPRQLRLRDLGGVIICDFIDLRFERHRRELYERMAENFQKDRAKTRVLPMSQFGIIELTRQRMRPSLKRSIYLDCPSCKGAGLVKSPESMSLDVMRRLAIAANDARVIRIELAVCGEVAFYLQNRKRQALADLETEHKKRILIKSDASLGLDEAKLLLYDAREGMVYIEELGMFPEPAPGTGDRQHGDRPGQRGGRRDRGRGRDRHQGPGGRHQQSRSPSDEEPHSMERAEQDVDDREDQDEGQGEEPGRADEAPGSGEQPAIVAEGPGSNEPRPYNRGPSEGGPNEAGEDGGRRRKRRRRGRRGRGRSGQGGQNFSGQPYGDAAPGDPNRREIDGPRDMDAPGDSDGPPDSEQRSERDAEPRADGPRDPDAPPSEDMDDQPQPAGPGESQPGLEEGGEPRRRRRRRGGRGRGRNRRPEPDGNVNPAVAKQPLPPAPEPEQAQSRRRGISPPRRRPPHHLTDSAPQSTQRPIVPTEPIVRTGSADRHLASDEPVNPQPLVRPRSVSDLDHIPDDFD